MPFLKYDAAAAQLGVTVGQLRLMVFRKAVPFYRIAPRTVRFSEADLRAWLESKRGGPSVATEASK